MEKTKLTWTKSYPKKRVTYHFYKKITANFNYNTTNKVEETLIQRAVQTTIQILYDKGLFDIFQNGNKVLKDLFFTTRQRPDLEEVNDVTQ